MTSQEPTGRHRRSRSNYQAPWSKKGWYSDQQQANRDPALDQAVEGAGHGLVPAGYAEDRPGLAIAPGFHNPYLNFIATPVAVWLFFFITDKLKGMPALAIGLGILFGLGAAVPFLMSVIRIPAWHRGRKAAKLYISEHGGVFPPELRWYS